MKYTIDDKYLDVLIEALDDFQYALALKLNDFKGQALTKERKELTRKQKLVEQLRETLGH